MVWDVIIGALKILGALGFFLYGMKIMSEGLQQVAGNKMRQVLGAMTTNRYTGVVTGFIITAILQSSSATTVMTVSFVNAGLLTLSESAGVMMGANIGTTITAWLVSVIGFKFNIANIALPIIAFSLPMMFSSREKTKRWGESIIGFALLFLGLAALKDAVPDLRENEAVLSFLEEFGNPGFFSRLMFVLIGTLITVIMQSSSAAMTLTIALVAKGLPLDIAAAMVLGENIGTTITAELSSLVANVHAKRSARVHSLFNIVGVTWMIFMAPFFLTLIDLVFPTPPSGNANEFALAAFHTTFNVLNVLLLIGFSNRLVKIATRMVKSKGEDDEEFLLKYMERGFVNATSLSLEEAKKEVSQYGGVTSNILGLLKDQSNAVKEKKILKLNKKIKKVENISDEAEEQIVAFLVKIGEAKLSASSSNEVKDLLSIVTDLERVCDISLRMSNDIVRKFNYEVTFSEEQTAKLNELAGFVDKAVSIMQNNIDSYELDVEKAQQQESIINSCVKKMRKAQFENIDSTVYDVKAGIIYRDLYNAYEKIGDHLINVTEALATEHEND